MTRSSFLDMATRTRQRAPALLRSAKSSATATPACSASQKKQQIPTKLRGFLECRRWIDRGWRNTRICLKLPRSTTMPAIGYGTVRIKGVSVDWASTETPRTRRDPSLRQMPAFSNSLTRRVYLLASSVESTTTSFLVRCASSFVSNKTQPPRPLSRLLGLVHHTPFDVVEILSLPG